MVYKFWCAERESNPHDFWSRDFKSLASTYSAIRASVMYYTKNMKQVLLIHGGDSFLSYDEYLADLKAATLDYERMKPTKRWKDTIIEELPDADILAPTMPNSSNAQYEEWKIWFEKILPFLGDDVRIIGHSLGAMFLAKYLHTNPLKKPVRQLILLAGGYDGDVNGYGSFAIESATGLEKSAEEIHLFHSKDDFCGTLQRAS